ncbi:sigma-70 family RNA polymerase sigma factor [Alkalibacterium olivapovliticus]|uniref:RNA polymerase sigma factor (Sigma-70 family) n=1 Tax=Alkalibacterium olivapovliticus TaxID=99907 RepID=A0A2T0W6T5_9LACT|nr:sigma-70 family RNA polymerase sigma factor [Alkalibacterium olivapovliticus]PRY82363.1 RNA polymerase sigma factor (sigma-70 family) [Alkalibacterium olivapovliticus]
MQIRTQDNTQTESKSYKDISDPINDALIFQIQSGDDAAFSVLLERCQPIIRRTTFRRYIKGYDREDLYQEACVVLVEASQKYDFSKGMSFNQYACLCIDNHFHRLIRWNNAMKRQSIRDALSLEGVMEDNGYQLAGHSNVVQPEDRPIIEETAEEYFTCLSSFEKEVCLYCYMGYSYDDIAEKLNCSRNKVLNAKHRCTEKYRKFFLF